MSLKKPKADDARMVKTRVKLHEALLELVAERNYEAISVPDIIAHAGIGYATFFRHYADKQALWSDIADEMIDNLLLQMTPLVRTADAAGEAHALCEYVDAHRSFFRSILTSGAASTVREELTRRATEQIQTLPLQPMRVPRELALVHAINACSGILTWWLEDHSDVSAEEMGDIIEHLVLKPLLA